MTEILIFKPPDDNSSKISKSSKTEEELLYKSFETNSVLSNYHFPLFLEMNHNSIKGKFVSSDIPSVLIRNIIDYCIPIINNYNTAEYKIKKVDIFNKQKKTNNIDTEYVIKSKLNKNILCLLNNNIYIAPAGDDINIIGVKLCKNLDKYIDKSSFNYFLNMHQLDYMISGKMGINELLSDFFNQSVFDSEKYRISDSDNIIYFKSNKDAVNKIGNIYHYVNYINNIYSFNYRIFLRHLCLYNENFYVSKKFIDSYSMDFVSFNKFKTLNTKPKTLYDSKEPTIEIDKNSIKIIRNSMDDKSYLCNTSFGCSNVFDFYNMDFLLYKKKIMDFFYKINILGTGNKLSKKLINEFNLMTSYNNSQNNKKMIELQMINSLRKNIEIKKFGIVETLSNEQIKIVNAEVKKINSGKENKDKNFDIWKEYRNLENNIMEGIDTKNIKELKKCLSLIEKILKIDKSNDFLNDTMFKDNKNIDVICPHILQNAYELIKTDKTLRSGAEKNTTIKIYGDIRKKIIENFSLPLVSDGYFCKICGEKIAENDDDDIIHFISGKRVSFIKENDFISDIIWKEVAYILSSVVLFRNKVNLKKIINNITATLREKIGEIYVNLAKNKINTSDDLTNLLKLYINIYTIAVVIQMIYKNYGNITFSIRGTKKNGGNAKNNHSSYINYNSDNTNSNTRINSGYIKGGKKDDKAEILKNIINNGLFVIIKTKYVLISNLNNISKDSIKGILLNAYKWTTELGIEKSKDETEEMGNIEYEKMERNEIYRYISYILILNNAKKTNDILKNNIKLKDVLGRSYETIQNEIKLYGLYHTLSIPNKPSVMPDYKYDSFSLVANYIKNRLFDLNAVPYSETLKEFDNKFNKVKIAEDDANYLVKISTIKPYSEIHIINYLAYTMNEFNPDSIVLDKYYDNMGKDHKFDIFIYQNVNDKGVIGGKKIEYNIGDINKIFKSFDISSSGEELKNNKKHIEFYNKYKKMILVNRKCSICNKLDNFSKKNNASIEKKLNEKNKLITFYEYYESICPNGELHEYKLNNNNCIKCGINDNIKNDLSINYYKKYLSNYNKIKEKKHFILNDIIKSNKATAVKKNKINNINKWSFSTDIIKKISTKFNINYNIWSNLGSSYKYDFKDIEKNKINPINNIDSIYDIKFRCSIVKSYIKYMPIILNTILNYNILNYVPYNLKKILEKNNISNMDKKISINSFNKNFNMEYEIYSDTEKPEIFYNYLLNSLSKFLLDLYDELEKNKVNIKKEIILYIINNIIKSERIFSKIDINKYKTTIIKIDDCVENEYINDMGESGDEDEDIVKDNSIDDDDNDDIFSRGDIDITNEDEDVDDDVIADI